MARMFPPDIEDHGRATPGESLFFRFVRIPVLWASRNVAVKESFDNTADRVTLISVHSSKGLDFECVYLVGMDPGVRNESSAPGAKTAALVGMTRARYSLTILRYIRAALSTKVTKDHEYVRDFSWEFVDG